MSEPLILPRNCGNCQHFDGEGWCALPNDGKPRPLYHFIYSPSDVTCTRQEPKDSDDVDGAAV